jgi:hypothetical protein
MTGKPRRAEPIVPQTQRECDAWIEGFAAAACIHSGYRERYEQFRDAYLKGRALMESGTPGVVVR